MFQIEDFDPVQVQKLMDDKKLRRKPAHYIPFDEMAVNQCVTIPGGLVTNGNCRIRAQRHSINGKLFNTRKEGKDTVIYRFK